MLATEKLDAYLATESGLRPSSPAGGPAIKAQSLSGAGPDAQRPAVRTPGARKSSPEIGQAAVNLVMCGFVGLLATLTGIGYLLFGALILRLIAGWGCS